VGCVLDLRGGGAGPRRGQRSGAHLSCGLRDPQPPQRDYCISLSLSLLSLSLSLSLSFFLSFFLVLKIEMGCREWLWAPRCRCSGFWCPSWCWWAGCSATPWTCSSACSRCLACCWLCWPRPPFSTRERAIGSQAACWCVPTAWWPRATAFTGKTLMDNAINSPSSLSFSSSSSLCILILRNPVFLTLNFFNLYMKIEGIKLNKHAHPKRVTQNTQHTHTHTQHTHTHNIQHKTIPRTQHSHMTTNSPCCGSPAWRVSP